MLNEAILDIVYNGNTIMVLPFTIYHNGTLSQKY